jgi:hypothetical protein
VSQWYLIWKDNPQVRGAPPSEVETDGGTAWVFSENGPLVMPSGEGRVGDGEARGGGSSQGKPSTG